MLIEDTRQMIYRNGCRGGLVLMSAMSGIDMTLWDIKGKAYGQPIHALMGGPVQQGAHLSLDRRRPAQIT